MDDLVLLEFSAPMPIGSSSFSVTLSSPRNGWIAFQLTAGETRFDTAFS